MPLQSVSAANRKSLDSPESRGYRAQMSTSTSRERPIIFSGPMVRAILAGQKTQTRRIVKPQPEPMPDGMWRHPKLDARGWWWRCAAVRSMVSVDEMQCVCPYGQPGDRLWVRETCEIQCAGGIMQGGTGEWSYAVTYKADMAERELAYVGPADADPYVDYSRDGWRSSIHMPRWASRITLDIAGVRVERLHDISQEDAHAEGLKAITKDNGHTYKYGIPDRDGLPGTDEDGWPWPDWSADARVAFQTLWTKINGAESWAANPWVWVVAFRRVQP